MFPDLLSLDVRHIAYGLSASLNIDLLGDSGWSASLQGVGQFFYILLLVVLVSVLAYYTTRWVASARFGRLGKRNLEIVESIGVGTQAYVHLVRVGKKYALVGVTRMQVSPLYELSEDDLIFDEATGGTNFQTIFSRFQNKEESEEAAENPNTMNESDGSEKEQ
jgi:flagellar protein FliO/FliZ